MKKSVRILAVLLALCMVLSLALQTFAAEPVLSQASVPSSIRPNANIPTFITMPRDYSADKTYPLVLLLHGHGGNHNEWGGYDAISNALAYEGKIVVTLDFPGCGDSQESFRLNTMTNMKQDVLDVIAFMKTACKIDTVSAMGYSMGGRILLEIIAEEKFDFDSVVFVAPAEDTEDLKNLFGGAANWDTLKASANTNGYADFTTIYGQQQELSKEWFADLEKYADGLAELAAPKFKGRSMVIYATDDTAVSPWVSQGVADAFQCPVLKTYKEGHSYSFYGYDGIVMITVIDGTVAFFTGGNLLPFTDVKQTDWFYSEVNYAYYRGLMIGTSDASFEPHTTTTRGMVVTMLYRIDGEQGVTTTSSFADVEAGKYYENAVAWAAEKKIVEGYGDGKFGPNDPITREQMATILYRYAQYKEYATVIATEHRAFADAAKISAWAKDAMTWAVQVELINGMGNDILDPQGNAERCQVAAILTRFCNTVVK
ncbi:MAG: alpha/beta fold hydrolase [Oscillospiraceae bacterium]|jgi:pimeloyl-ACP methyl ester carboxylesterase|nr:alpha/beta fold hydrolase [Oscillospiraceae bacterium]